MPCRPGAVSGHAQPQSGASLSRPRAPGKLKGSGLVFYRPGTDDHGLPHNPFKAIVAPRPIAWVSSLGPTGIANLAPYSFFNAFADRPPMVAYGSGREKIGIDEGKDSVRNIAATGEFVVNLVSRGLMSEMNVSAQHYPADVDEFEAAGLAKAACETVAVPRVAAAPAALECKLWQILDLPGGRDQMVIGEVTGIHIDDTLIRDGRFDVTLFQPLARLGYRDYAAVETVFELTRPDD